MSFPYYQTITAPTDVAKTDNIPDNALSNYLSYKKHIANKSGLKINTIQSKASSNDLYTNTVSPFKAIRLYLSICKPLSTVNANKHKVPTE